MSTCDYFQRFVADAKANMHDQEKRVALCRHLDTCQDCRDQVQEGMKEVFEKVTPQDWDEVMRLHREDRELL